MRRFGLAIMTIAALLASSFAPLVVNAQGVVWVRTTDRVGPNGCDEKVAAWSDGTFTAAVVDCGGQDVGAGSLTYLGYYERLGSDDCREGVSYWSDGQETWVPLDCPPGVVYVKPEWSQRAPWSRQDPYGAVRRPTRGQSPSPARPTVSVQPAQPAAPVNQPQQPTYTPPPPVPQPPAPRGVPNDPSVQVVAATIDYLCAQRIDARKTTITFGGRIRQGATFDSPYIRLLDARIAQEQLYYYNLTGQQLPLPAGCAPGS